MLMRNRVGRYDLIVFIFWDDIKAAAIVKRISDLFTTIHNKNFPA